MTFKFDNPSANMLEKSTLPRMAEADHKVRSSYSLVMDMLDATKEFGINLPRDVPGAVADPVREKVAAAEPAPVRPAAGSRPTPVPAPSGPSV